MDSIRPEICDVVFLNVSKALNIFVKRNGMLFEEIDVVLNRLAEEWNQKKIPLYLKWALDTHPELFDQQINKKDSSGIYK